MDNNIKVRPVEQLTDWRQASQLPIEKLRADAGKRIEMANKTIADAKTALAAGTVPGADARLDSAVMLKAPVPAGGAQPEFSDKVLRQSAMDMQLARGSRARLRQRGASPVRIESRNAQVMQAAAQFDSRLMALRDDPAGRQARTQLNKLQQSTLQSFSPAGPSDGAKADARRALEQLIQRESEHRRKLALQNFRLEEFEKKGVDVAKIESGSMKAPTVLADRNRRKPGMSLTELQRRGARPKL